MTRVPERPAAQAVILITGSTDGLGREVARRMSATGAHVIVHGRNRQRGEALVAEIAREGKGSARFYAADFASLSRVRELGQSILRDYERLDALVNNAGIWLAATNDRQLSADGHELHFAVNYLSGFLLTRMLLPLLKKSSQSRIVNVSSLAQSPIDFDNVMLERGYSASRGYGQSKLAQVMLTFDLARMPTRPRSGVIVRSVRVRADGKAFSLARLVIPERQGEAEARPRAHGGSHGQCPAVRTGDILGEKEAQS